MVRLMKREVVDGVNLDVVYMECENEAEAHSMIPPPDVDDGIYFIEGTITQVEVQDLETPPW